MSVPQLFRKARLNATTIKPHVGQRSFPVFAALDDTLCRRSLTRASYLGGSFTLPCPANAWQPSPVATVHARVHVHRGRATLLRAVCARASRPRSIAARRVCTCIEAAQHCYAPCVHVHRGRATLLREIGTRASGTARSVLHGIVQAKILKSSPSSRRGHLASVPGA